MGPYGVIADIHGNREALGAVLAALDARGIKRLACLGDVIGYNADPDECAAMLRERQVPAIAGNHDLIGLGRLDTRRCSNKARYALQRTRRTLRGETRAWLATLPANRVLEPGVVLVHGGVRDVQQYMVTPALIAHNAALLREDFPGARLCFFGHSHEQKIYEVHGGVVQEISLQERFALRPERTYFVNPGSVDAARKQRHKLAECAIFDAGAGAIEFLRVRYDAASAEVKARAFGYRIGPLTDRLYTWQRRVRRVAARMLPIGSI
ncbi:MAG: metallophosphoesterase family protein [Betaproteobacteria bacterium]